MKRNRWLSPLFLLVILSQGACAPTSMPPAAMTAAASAVVQSEDGCPVPGASHELMRNDADGFCLLYPAGYSTEIPNYIVINPNGAPGDAPGDAWAAVYVEPAAGRTAAQAADAKITEAGPGFNIARTEVTVDGVPAVVVDGLPGPDPLRRVFIVQNDRLYSVYFMPWGSGNASFSLLETLFTSIMESLRFIPPAKPNP